MNARRFLAGTWTIYRTGGPLHLVFSDLWSGLKWMLRGWQ